MDRPRPRPGAALTAAAALAIGVGMAVGEEAPPIRAMHWAAQTADPVRAFGSAPPECLALPADADQALSVEVGRAAFRTPVLLGGQAARAGLACETCHKDGRANPDFQFPGLSGAPGTADVTSSLFSTHRGDDVFDPKPIPDLSGPKSTLKIDQKPQGRALEHFIHGLVTEEFDGPEPPAPVLAGLAAYVRALRPEACPARERDPVTAASLMDDARRAVAAGRLEAAHGERPTAILMLASARASLGQIDERYAGPELAPQRERLHAASLRLAAVQERLRQRAPAPAPAPAEAHDVQRELARWIADSRGLQARLEGAEPASLFDPARLTEAAKRRLPG